MSEAFPEWSKSMNEAFGYAMKAASEGLKQTEAYVQYRAGGGEIRKEWWADVYQTAFQQVGQREEIKSIPLHWKIPEHMFLEPEAPIDWSTKYVFKSEIEYFNLDTQRWESKWISSGFDELPTHAEWRADALRRLVMEETSPAIRDVAEVRFITEETWKRRGT